MIAITTGLVSHKNFNIFVKFQTFQYNGLVSHKNLHVFVKFQIFQTDYILYYNYNNIKYFIYFNVSMIIARIIDQIYIFKLLYVYILIYIHIYIYVCVCI